MIPGQPLGLVLTTLLADTARNVRRVCPALDVIATNSCQGGVLQGRPFMIGLGQPPNLIRGEAKVVQRLAEWFAVVDRIEEFLPTVDGQPPLRSGAGPVLWASLCARRQRVQRQRVCQPAEVPWHVLVTARTLGFATDAKPLLM